MFLSSLMLAFFHVGCRGDDDKGDKDDDDDENSLLEEASPLRGRLQAALERGVRPAVMASDSRV